MKIVFFFTAIIVLSFIACTNNKSETERNEKSSNISQQNKSKDKDISKINVCELIPAELLASEIGGKVKKPAQHSDYGSTQGCEYEIDPAGSDNYEYCAIWFYPVSMYEDSQAALETAEGLDQNATAEKLSGYGDDAFVVNNASEHQSIIHVLLKDKMYVEVKAENFEDAKKITSLVLSKIK